MGKKDENLLKLQDKNNKIVVGLKQTLRALENNEAEIVFIAEDADNKIVEKVKLEPYEKDHIALLVEKNF